MKTHKFKRLAALIAFMCLLTSCAPSSPPVGAPAIEQPAPEVPAISPQPDAEPEKESGVTAGEEPYPGYYVIDKIYGDMAQRAEEYAPKVTTLSNGVQVQRTPTEYYAGVYHNPGESISYNTFYLDADNRGCAACHSDMNATLKNMTYNHVDLSNSFGIQSTVQQCLDCHSYSPGYVTEFYGLGTLLHAIHESEQFTGSCWSCHNATNDGSGMQLWDLNKHKLLRGIVDIENIEGTFSFAQDRKVNAEDVFFFNWMYYDNDYSRYAAEMAGAPLDPKVFDEWEITVNGHVENEFTVKLTDLIKEGLSVTTTMTMPCTINPTGGPLIANCEITGIPLKTLLERAGVKKGATVMLPTATDGFCIPIFMDHIDQFDAYLVYEIDGKRLSHIHGYPLQLWPGGGSAAEFIKQVSVLTITNEPKEDYYMYLGWEKEDGGYYNKPNVGIFDVQEGQIIKVGRPFTFTGYANAFNQKVVQMEFSMDRGVTWMAFDTSASEADKWINWNFTFTPQDSGAYVLMVRATTEGGLISNTPTEIMINAK